MTERSVLVQERRRPAGVRPASADTAWKWVGWFGLVLALAGLTDLVLLWVPMRLGLPEWEFATAVSTTSALPLVSIGAAGILAFAASHGIRWLLWVVGVLMAVAAVVVAAVLLLFLTDVPLAWNASAGAARVGIVKASVKTGALALLFGSVYAVAAVWSIRLATGKAEG